MNSNEEFQKRIVSLLEKQNETMAKIASAIGTMESHSCLDHDQKPFPGQDAENHEPAWRALYETLLTSMRQRVEKWRNGMDSTLIFVALFVTVVTTFQGPVSQNLTANPADTTNELLNNLTTIIYDIAILNGLKAPVDLPGPAPFKRSQSDEILTLLWYSALILSLITAILSVYGRQWMDYLTEKPEGQSYKVKSMRLNFRAMLANKLLRPALESIHSILVLSVLLFVAGLLYQLWSIALSGTVKSRILILTSSIGSSFIFITLIFTLCTFLHGVLCEESPFTTTSAMIIRQTLPLDPVVPFPIHRIEKDLYQFFCASIIQIAEPDHFDQVSSVRLFQHQVHPNTLDQLELIVDAVVFLLSSDASLKAKQTVAWNFIGMWVLDEIIEEDSDRIERCHYQLQDALRFAYSNTPPGQEKIRRCFFAAEVAILLTFSGECFSNPVPSAYPESRILSRLFINTFKLLPEKFAYRVDLSYTKENAIFEYERLIQEHPHSINDVSLDAGLLSAFLNGGTNDDDETPDDRWKDFILKHLNDSDVAKLLSEIVSKSTETNDYLLLINLLYRILLSLRPLHLTLPEDFNLSNFFGFAVSHWQECQKSSVRLELLHAGVFEATPIDICLSYLSIMDGKLLARQEGISEFLKELDELDLQSERPKIHDALLPVDLSTLRCCIIALPDDRDENQIVGSNYSFDELFGSADFLLPILEWKVQYPDGYGP